MRTWFADAGNGIHDFYATIFHAKEVHTDTLCVGKVCVTEEQFLRMVQKSNVAEVTATVQNSDTPATPVLSVETEVKKIVIPEVVTVKEIPQESAGIPPIPPVIEKVPVVEEVPSIVSDVPAS